MNNQETFNIVNNHLHTMPGRSINKETGRRIDHLMVINAL